MGKGFDGEEFSGVVGKVVSQRDSFGAREREV
jgi:hypothetical protein